MEGKRDASLQGWIIWSEEQNQMELLIRSWRPHSKHWMEGHLSIASQKPRSWHFNDHLIGLENIDFILVNLAFKHTSSHNRSCLASLPASLTLWFESTLALLDSLSCIPKPVSRQSLEKGASTLRDSAHNNAPLLTILGKNCQTDYSWEKIRCVAHVQSY